MNHQNFGPNLKELMSRLKISQSQLARMTGQSRVNVSRIVNGHKGMSLKTAVRIAVVLGVKLEDLLK